MITKLEKYKNFNHFQSLLKEFDELGLDIGEYSIFGSGPLAVRGIVYAHDIDVIVKKDSWRFGHLEKNKTKRIGNVELSVGWPGSFDFFLPDKNICIEYNGEQHYSPIDYFGGLDRLIIQRKRDRIKKTFCKTHNIRLITLHYKHKNIKIILEKLLLP